MILTPWDFIMDLSNPDLWFLLKALMVSCMSAFICGIVGVHVVLRGMAFIGDAVAHAVFPGLAVAFVIGGNLVVGGVVSGVVTAIIVAVLSQYRRIGEDTVIGIVFAAAFALGIVIISQAPGYAGSLQSFLFGSITGIPDSDIVMVAVAGSIIVTILTVVRRPLIAVSLDRELAAADGLPVFALDLLLYVIVSVSVVLSVQTIGNVLVLSLLVAPAATARLLTDSFTVMSILSPLIAVVGVTLGMYVSWSVENAPAGGTIVLTLTGIFILTWIVSPKHGLLAKALHTQRAHRSV